MTREPWSSGSSAVCLGWTGSISQITPSILFCDFSRLRLIFFVWMLDGAWCFANRAVWFIDIATNYL